MKVLIRIMLGQSRIRWCGGKKCALPYIAIAEQAEKNAEFHMQVLFFSASGYSSQAVEYANEVRMALFIYGETGAITPVNPEAVRIYDFRSRTRAERTAMGKARNGSRRDRY